MFEVAQIVFLIPHSNASAERLFSLGNKNKNELSGRNRLDQDKTLFSILAVKLDRPDTCMVANCCQLKFESPT